MLTVACHSEPLSSDWSIPYRTTQKRIAHGSPQSLPSKSPSKSPTPATEREKKLAASKRKAKSVSPIRTPTQGANPKCRPKSSLLQRLPSNGLRNDPFAQFPVDIANGSSVPETMDYFYKMFGPGYNAGSMVPGHRQPAFSIILPLAQEHDLIFHGLMSLCRATWQLTSKRDAAADPAFVYHRGKALSTLRGRLTSTNPLPNEIAMLSVLQLLETEFVLGNLETVAVHIKGLKKMLKLREETANTPCTQMIQGNLSGVEAFLRVAEQDSGRITAELEEEESPAYEEDRQYPCHPFDSDLCEKLSSYPSGFTDVAMDGGVSIQILNVLSLVRQTTDYVLENPTVEPPQVADEKCLSVHFMKLENSKNTAMEDYLLAALAAYCLQLSPRPKNAVVANRWVAKLMKLYSDTYLLKLPDSRQSLVLWACTSIASLAKQQGESCDIPEAHSLLENIVKVFKMHGRKLRWKHIEKTLQSFFWIEDIGARWQENWMQALNAG